MPSSTSNSERGAPGPIRGIPGNLRANTEALRSLVRAPQLFVLSYAALIVLMLACVVTDRMMASYGCLGVALVWIALARDTRRVAMVILIAAVGFFAIGETYIRLYYFGPAALARPWEYTDAGLRDRRSGIRFDPTSFTNLARSQSGRSRGASFTTNQHGFRTADWSAERKPGSLRVLLLGSSLTMGTGVDQHLVYGAQLEAILGTRTQREVEVINLAMQGWGLDAMTHALQEVGLPLEPDVVLVEATPDVILMRGLKPLLANWPDATLNDPYFRSHGTLPTLQKLLLTLESPKRTLFFFNAVHITAQSGRSQSSPISELGDEMRQHAVTQLDHIRSLAGHTPVHLIAPRPVWLGDVDLESRAYFRALAEWRDFGFIDTFGIEADEHPRDLAIFFYDRHPGPELHRRYAVVIADSLAEFTNPHP